MRLRSHRASSCARCGGSVVLETRTIPAVTQLGVMLWRCLPGPVQRSAIRHLFAELTDLGCGSGPPASAPSWCRGHTVVLLLLPRIPRRRKKVAACAASGKYVALLPPAWNHRRRWDRDVAPVLSNKNHESCPSATRSPSGWLPSERIC